MVSLVLAAIATLVVVTVEIVTYRATTATTTTREPDPGLVPGQSVVTAAKSIKKRFIAMNAWRTGLATIVVAEKTVSRRGFSILAMSTRQGARLLSF